MAAVDALDTRAPAIGLLKRRVPTPVTLDCFVWPYGPNIDVAARGRLLDWAERHRLRLSNRGDGCLHWLVTGRCTEPECSPRAAAWMDHVTAWTRDGEPAVLVAQPYVLEDDDKADLVGLAGEPSIRVEAEQTGSWYGHGTWFVGLWRAEAAA